MKIICCNAAFDERGRILIGRRGPAVSEFVGCWELPGGKLESFDLSVYGAAQRELYEETRLVSEGMTLVDAITQGERCFLFFTSVIPGRQTAVSDGRSHSELKFVELRDVPIPEMTPSNQVFMAENAALLGEHAKQIRENS